MGSLLKHDKSSTSQALYESKISFYRPNSIASALAVCMHLMNGLVSMMTLSKVILFLSKYSFRHLPESSPYSNPNSVRLGSILLCVGRPLWSVRSPCLTVAANDTTFSLCGEGF